MQPERNDLELYEQQLEKLSIQKIDRGIRITLSMCILFYRLQSPYPLGNQLDLHKELSEVDWRQEF